MKEPRIAHSCNFWGWNSTPSSWDWSLPPELTLSSPMLWWGLYRRTGNDILIPIMFWWHLWLKITFSVLIFWYKRILKQNHKIHPNSIFSPKKRGNWCVCTNAFHLLAPWKSSFLEEKLKVLTSLWWEALPEAVRPCSCSLASHLRCCKGATGLSKWRKWIPAFSLWEISAHCILTL